jgi:hypothetical protein
MSFFHHLIFSVMNIFLKSLAMLAVAVVVVGCSSNNDPGSTQSTERFTFRVGDYAVYQNTQLDSLNRPVSSGTGIIPSYRSSRTVVRSGVSLGGQNDAFLLIDSSFIPTTGLPAGVTGGTRVDTSYYRVANDEVFVWFDANRALNSVNGLSTGGVPRFTGLTPQWYKVAELRDAAGSEFSTNLSFNVVDMTLGTLPFTLVLTGKNTGRTTLTLNGASSTVHRQSSRVRASFTVPLLGSLSVEVPSEVDFGVPSAGAQRAILRTQTNSVSITIPLLGTQAIPGALSTLVSFRAGT